MQEAAPKSWARQVLREPGDGSGAKALHRFKSGQSNRASSELARRYNQTTGGKREAARSSAARAARRSTRTA